jgi:myo-inositol-1(or 4)-monophosphatase
MQEAVVLAELAARRAGRLLAERAGHPGRTSTKSSFVDMVTEVDIAAGVEAIEELMAGDPDATFLCEEPEVYDLTGAPRGSLDDRAVWVVDPIDGTTSFIHGFPTFSVSVARLEGGRPVAGVVYNVPGDELFAAREGAGATLDGVPISVSDADSISRALIVTGFPYDRGAALDRQMAVFGSIIREVHGIRRDGSAAVDCCHVAAGRADAFWEYGLKPWDTNAGVLIAMEAGAVVTGIDGAPWLPETADIIVAPPSLHPVLLAAIRAADPMQ